MRAADDVLQESLRVLQLSTLRADPLQSLLNNLGTTFLASMEHKPYLGKAHTDALTCLNDTESTNGLLRVNPMARCGTLRDDNPHVVPVSQNVNVDTDLSGSLTDLQ